MQKELFYLTLAIGWMTSLNAWADTKLEAENADYSDCTVVSDNKYSGGEALKLTETTAKITFDVNIDKKGKYALFAAGDGIGGSKIVNCSVNGSSGQFSLDTYAEVEMGTFFLSEGQNKIEITPNWTWFDIDYIRIASPQDEYTFDIAAVPVDENATDAAKNMYSFLLDNFGKKTISGIMTGDMSSANGDVTAHDDVKAVYEVSGKHPALVGFDFLFATGRTENEGWCKDYTHKTIELAKDLYSRGGFPAFTWHWHDPSRKTDDFYSDKSSVSISQALNSDGSWNTSSELYEYIIHDIDLIADYFLELQEAGVACIFRPLHEASGGWFWWGRNKNATDFVKLFQLVFDEMTQVKGVHNVLWVWNAGADDTDWNPGAEYYDFVSADIYNPAFDYSSNGSTFDKLKALTQGKKIIALSENGPVPDIEKQAEEEAMWSWWMPWYQTWDGKFVDQTSPEQWRKCMNDDRIITLEDMNSWNAVETISSVHSHNIIYDLNGHRLLREPSHGLYIKNGKKIFQHN